MNISELIERLEEYRDELGDVEVRLMTQSNWPFENRIVGLASGAEINAAATNDDADGENGPDHENEPENADGAVYIVEGDQICYGNKLAWEVARR